MCACLFFISDKKSFFHNFFLPLSLFLLLFLSFCLAKILNFFQSVCKKRTFFAKKIEKDGIDSFLLRYVIISKLCESINKSFIFENRTFGFKNKTFIFKNKTFIYRFVQVFSLFCCLFVPNLISVLQVVCRTVRPTCSKDRR